MNDELKSAKNKIEAKKRIKTLKDQARLEKLYLDMGMESPAMWSERKAKALEDEYVATPLATKQEFLDLMAKGNNLGKARELLGISMEVACQIILRNVDTIEIFPTKAKV